MSRALAVDNRLEAIAGVPSIMTSTPYYATISGPGTAVFLGKKFTASTYAVGIQNRIGASTPTVNCFLGLAGEVSSVGSTLASSSADALAWAALATSPNLGLGRGAVAEQSWNAPFIGVFYDRVLSLGEQRLVLGWLARRLSTSL